MMIIISYFIVFPFDMVRKYIETTIGEIGKLFPKKIHATNLNGFLLKIALFLFAIKLIRLLFNN